MPSLPPARSSFNPSTGLREALHDPKGNLLLKGDWSGRRLCSLHIRIPYSGQSTWLSIFPNQVWHNSFGLSDLIALLPKADAPRKNLTLFQHIEYSDLSFLPPLDNPAALPPFGGMLLLNVLSWLAKDQGVKHLRYRGPYPTEKLCASLLTCFDPLQGKEEAKKRFAAAPVDLLFPSREVPIDWAPRPFSIQWASAETMVIYREEIELVSHRGIPYTPRKSGPVLQEVTFQGTRYTAGRVMALQCPSEPLFLLDQQGELVWELPAQETPLTARAETREVPEDLARLLTEKAVAESPSPLAEAVQKIARSSCWIFGELGGAPATWHEGVLTLNLLWGKALANSRHRGCEQSLQRCAEELAPFTTPLLKKKAQQLLLRTVQTSPKG